MNKNDLIKKVAAENGLTQKEAAAVVSSVLNGIMDSLAAREPVTLFGFGSFSCKHRDGKPFAVGPMAENEVLVGPGVFGLRGVALRDKADQFLFCHLGTTSGPDSAFLPTA